MFVWLCIMDELAEKGIIKSILNEIDELTGMGGVYHSQGKAQPLLGKKICKFCKFCLQHPHLKNRCRYACHGASMQSMTSGEPHYQRCWAGLLYVSVAIAPNANYMGGISLGGFCAKGETREIGEWLVKQLAVETELDQAQILALTQTLHEIDAHTLRGFGLFLLEATLSSGINSGNWFGKQHSEYMLQRKIAEACQELKQTPIDKQTVMSDGYRLVSYMQKRDRDGAQQFIARYLAKLLILSNWDLLRLRAYVRVLLAVITSQNILDGMDWDVATRREWIYMNRIEKADDTKKVCVEVADIVHQHFSKAKVFIDAERKLSDRVSEWLEHNCQERADLQSASKAVGASVSSIAHRLPQEIGKSYSELRRDIRITRAKRLLALSDMEISAIADACGFVDQSHFTKTFKEQINLTPGVFRKMLHLES